MHNEECTMHQKYMLMALEMARTGLGRTWPNPAVGCIIVNEGQIIAATRTADGGRPHAETLALKSAIGNRQSAIYVTLEPCAHQGKNPSCAESLVKAGAAEVVIGCLDPDPRTSGKGAEILRRAGIMVTIGVLEKECREVNKGFFKVIEKFLPYVTLKAAVSADYKYLPGDGTPRWVTGEKAREEVHRLRSIYDAILTGTGTILADNPQLNVRLPGMENRSPLKVVVGSQKIPGHSNIFKGKEVWLYGERVENVLPDLAERGITRLMVEAGPRLSNAMLAAGLVDEVIIFQSSKNLGEAGRDFFEKDVLNKFKKIEEKKIGDDLKITLNFPLEGESK